MLAESNTSKYLICFNFQYLYYPLPKSLLSYSTDVSAICSSHHQPLEFSGLRVYIAPLVTESALCTSQYSRYPSVQLV